jgi:hypothetical protein
VSVSSLLALLIACEDPINEPALGPTNAARAVPADESDVSALGDDA